MTNFEYQPRTAYDVEQRIGQDREGGKVPKADNETRCETCGHVKEFHCKKFRKGEKPRGYLWVWNHQQPRFRAPVLCRHYDPSNPLAVLLCNSTACTVADCDCGSFVSPFRKPKKPKAPTAKPAAMRKRAAKRNAQQLELAISSSDFGVPS